MAPEFLQGLCTPINAFARETAAECVALRFDVGIVSKIQQALIGHAGLMKQVHIIADS
jgi:hypothetical protein